MSWVAVAVAAGAGAVKHFAVDKPAANRQRDLQAETTRWSPWTGMKGEAPQEPNLMGSMMDAGVTGAMMSQNSKAFEKQSELSDAMKGYYDRGGTGSLANKYSWAPREGFTGGTGVTAPTGYQSRYFGKLGR